jgi:seryl-tRNA synthetase
MPLDINDFRPEKGGNPDLVRDTLRKRFKDVAIVDAVIASDKKWRESNFKDEEFSKFINKTSKDIGELKKQKKDAEAAVLMEQVKEQKTALEANKKITAEINAQTLKLISSIGNYVHVSLSA